MERGYVKLWRKTFDSGLMQNPMAFTLFCHLLFNANLKGRSFTSCGKVIELAPGDAIFSRIRIAHELNISEQNARTALKFLERLGILTTKSTNKFTIVSFVNWDRYQQQDNNSQPTNQPTTNQQLTSNSPTTNQQLTTALRKEESKKVRMEEIKDSGGQAPAPTPARARFIPPTVEEVQAYAQSMGKRIDAQRFVDFYASKNWMVGKNKMANWRAAVSGWIHREEERNQQHVFAGNSSYQPSNLSDLVGW